MIIKNFNQLATSSLRKEALVIAEAGLAAIDTPLVVRSKVRLSGSKLTIDSKNFDLSQFVRVVCVGFGKASLAAVTELQQILGERIACGFVIDLREGDLANITCRVGTHPYPTLVNVQATQELLVMLNSCTERDLVLCVVSGGGSALLCYPNELTCEAETSLIAALTVKGATIQEINTVRKHISRVKGGNLAKACYPATVVSLIFSDIPGDDLGMVASGPTVRDDTTVSDASGILNRYEALAMCQMPSCALFETPKEDKYFEKVSNILMVSGRSALESCRRKADDLGFAVSIFSDDFSGEAKVLGEKVAAAAASLPKNSCLLGAGESTLLVKGIGRGGRNQELALGALSRLPENSVLAAVASDGADNTDAAGAIVDHSTMNAARRLQLDPQSYLDNNDSYHFFEAAGGHIMTGPTGANVSDFFVLLKQ